MKNVIGGLLVSAIVCICGPGVQSQDRPKPDAPVRSSKDKEKDKEKGREKGKDGAKGELTLSEFEKEVIALTNAERRKAGLSDLQAAPLLMTAARGHSENMAKQSKLDHVLDGKTPADRVKAVGYKYRRVGENVAWNQPTPKGVVEGWMNSEGHRANILNRDYTEIGVAMKTNARGEPYWTQVFGTPATK